MIDYLIYILAFVIGSIIGLVYSYKKHSEPFVAVNKFNKLAAVVSTIGWVLAFNSRSIIFCGIGYILAGFIMGERPGYGRKETLIGLVISIIVYLSLNWMYGGALYG